MSDRLFEPGDVYCLYVAPQQLNQLKKLLEGLGEGFSRLKRSVAEARATKRPHEDMTRKEHATWIGDQLLEVHSEFLTLVSGFEDWRESQRETSFAHTVQYEEVNDTILQLRAIATRLLQDREELKAVKLPGGYRDSKRETLRRWVK